MKQITNFLLIGLVLLGIVLVYDGFFIVEEGRQVMTKSCPPRERSR